MQYAQALAAESSKLEAEMHKKVYAPLESIEALESMEALDVIDAFIKGDEVQEMSEVVDVFIQGDEVQFDVTKTLITRVIPAPDGSKSRFISDECLDAARRAMDSHQFGVCFINISPYMLSTYIHR